jgi:hypothetical protein
VADTSGEGNLKFSMRPTRWWSVDYRSSPERNEAGCDHGERLRGRVPGSASTEAGAWAVSALPPGGAATPAVGDLVWVTFEGGDTDDPIWDAGAAHDPDAVPAVVDERRGYWTAGSVSGHA